MNFQKLLEDQCPVSEFATQISRTWEFFMLIRVINLIEIAGEFGTQALQIHERNTEQDMD